MLKFIKNTLNLANGHPRKTKHYFCAKYEEHFFLGKLLEKMRIEIVKTRNINILEGEFF